MTDYSNGRNVLLIRPEPGRHINPVKKEEVKKEELKIDVNSIADAVIKAISNKIPVIEKVKGKDDFDSSKSLEKLADVMSNAKEKEAKIEGLGNIKETRKDKKEIDKTIDLLKNLGD